MQIAQTDFSSGRCRPQDCMKMTQEYLSISRSFRAIRRKICKQDACRDLFSASLDNIKHNYNQYYEKKEEERDEYDVSDFYWAEDFYDYYYDDFDSFEDAEDYFDEYSEW